MAMTARRGRGPFRASGAAGAALAASVLLGACSGTTAPPPADESAPPAVSPAPGPTAEAALAPPPVPVGDVATGLAAPWSVAPLPDGSALVSERDSGRILRLGPGRPPTEAGAVPGVVAAGEGGLLGLAMSPDGTAVFAMHTADQDNRVVRMSWDGRRLGPASPVLTGIPKGQIHNGGRLAFGPDGLLSIATGDAGEPARAQDSGSLAGKILRVAPDGSVPGSNPLPGSPVYSLGHRNVQGLAFDGSGRLWASEFGAKDVDELNLIVPGGNYGWPQVEGTGGAPQFIDPAVAWSPTATASPSGIAVAEGSVWVASLRGGTLFQVPVGPDGTAGAPIAHLSGTYGRLRDVVAAPGGGLWLLTNNTDGRGEPRAGDDRIVALRLGP
jgi:glucose/arabinose dehydrogenase